jgi:hypothetical protein
MSHAEMASAPWLSVASFFRAQSVAHGRVRIAAVSAATTLVEPSAKQPADQAWPAAFIGACLRLAGYECSSRLALDSYRRFGRRLRRPRHGCIVLFQTPRYARSVGFCLSATADRLRVVSAKSSGEVRVTSLRMENVITLRWPVATAPLPIGSGLPTILSLDPDIAPPHLAPPILFDIGPRAGFAPHGVPPVVQSVDSGRQRTLSLDPDNAPPDFVTPIMIDLGSDTSFSPHVVPPVVQSIVIGRGLIDPDAVTADIRRLALDRQDRTALLIGSGEPGLDTAVTADMGRAMFGLKTPLI